MDAQDHLLLFQDVSRIWQPFREDIKRNRGFLNGSPYSSTDINYLTQTEREAFSWNIVLPKLLAFTGAERANRIMARAEAWEPGDRALAEVINPLLEQDNFETDFDEQISLAAKDAAIGRLGWLNLSFERSPRYHDGSYRLRRVDPGSIWADHDVPDPDFDSGRFILYSRWFSVDKIIQKYTETNAELSAELERLAEKFEGPLREKRKRSFANRYRTSSLLNYSTRGSSEDKAWDRSGERSLGDLNYDSRNTDFVDYNEGLYRVIELHEKRYFNRIYIEDFYKNINIQIPDAEVENREYIHNILMQHGLSDRAVKHRKDEITYVSVSAPGLHPKKIFYDKPYTVQGEGYSFKSIIFYNFGVDKRDCRCLVDVLIDPQRVVNHSVMSRSLIMAKVLNPDIMIGRRGIDDEEQLNQFKVRKPGRILQVNDINQVKYMEYPAGTSQLFTNVMTEAIHMSDESPGISKNMMGLRENAEESGRLVQVKVAQSETMLAEPFENIANTILKIERFHLGIVQKHISYPRFVRIVGRGGQQEATIRINQFDPAVGRTLNDVTTGKFDIRIDKTKYTKTERQFQFDRLYQIIQMVDPGMRIALLPDLFDLMDIPQADKLIQIAQDYVTMTMGPQTLQSKLSVLQLTQQLQQIQNPLLGKLQELQPAIQLQQAQMTMNQLLDPNVSITQKLQNEAQAKNLALQIAQLQQQVQMLQKQLEAQNIQGEIQKNQLNQQLRLLQDPEQASAAQDVARLSQIASKKQLETQIAQMEQALNQLSQATPAIASTNVPGISGGVSSETASSSEASDVQAQQDLILQKLQALMQDLPPDKLAAVQQAVSEITQLPVEQQIPAAMQLISQLEGGSKTSEAQSVALPEELQQLRASLTTEEKAEFDADIQRISQSPAAQQAVLTQKLYQGVLLRKNLEIGERELLIKIKEAISVFNTEDQQSLLLQLDQILASSGESRSEQLAGFYTYLLTLFRDTRVKPTQQAILSLIRTFPFTEQEEITKTLLEISNLPIAQQDSAYSELYKRLQQRQVQGYNQG